MSTTAAVGPREGRWSTPVTALAAVCCGVGAALSSVGAAGDVKLAVLLPAVICAGVIVTVVALTRFAVFVYLMLLVRSSVDLTKLTADDSLARLLTPSTLLAMLFIVAAALWLVARYRARQRLPGSGLRWALVIFLCASALSTVGASHPWYSVADVLRLLAIVLMFVVLEQLMAERQAMKRLLAAVFLSAIFPLLYTSFGYLVGSPPTEVKGEVVRVTGTFLQSNIFGRYLMMLVIVGVAVYPHVRGRLRIGFTGLLGLCAVYLILTYTLTATAGALIGLAVVALKQRKRLLLGLAAAVMVVLLVAPPLSARLATVANPGAYAAGAEDRSSLAWRLDYWPEVASLANDNPITGIGFGMTTFESETEAAPHNDYLRAYVETGVVGLVAYLALVWMLVWTGLAASRAAPAGSLERSTAVGYLGCAAAFAASSFAANQISGVAQLWYLVGFAAAASAILNRATGRAGQEDRPALATPRS